MLLRLLLISTLFFFTQNINAQQLDHVLGDVILKLTPDSNPETLAKKLERLNGISTEVEVVRELSAPFDIWLLHFDYVNINENEFLAAIFRQDEVEVAQLNHLVFERETTPDDPLFGDQWHWINPNDADIDADLAWDLTTGGYTAVGSHEIVVCVIEGGGADWDHPDLIDNHWMNLAEIDGDGIDNDNNGYIDDVHGWNTPQGNDNIGGANHGTQVSGIMGAKGNNALGVAGINWDLKIMQVMQGGIGNNNNPNEANVIAAYTYPYVMRKKYNDTNGEEGAFVVATNASWGIDGGDPENAPLWCAFYDSLGVEGILNCGATTNQNLDVDVEGDLPTACASDFMVSVARTGITDNHAGGFGATQVDLGAPGINVLMTNSGGGYGTSTGTSFASPLTAGVIALLYSAPCSQIGAAALTEPADVALAIKNAILEGVDLVPSLDGITLTGGRLNAFNALNIILETCGKCPAPFNLELTETLDTSVTINWLSTDSTFYTGIRWRQMDSTEWNEIDSIGKPFELTGLDACTFYEIQLQDVCADTLSDYTDSFIFETEGCCKTPELVEIVTIDDNSFSVEWTSVFATQSYNVKFFEPGFESIINVTTNSIAFENLQACELYGVQIQTVCDTGMTEFTPYIEILTKGCGNCIDLDYCLPQGNTQIESIERFSFGDFENVSADEEGYGDFTGLMEINVATFGIYNFEIERKLIQIPAFPQIYYMWIDYDQNGEFNNDDELIFQTNATEDLATGTLVIPPGTPTGTTRLRILMTDEDDPVNTACSTDFIGEAEDYCLNIEEGSEPECNPPSDLAAINIGFEEATLTFADDDEALEYIIQFREIGAPNWTTISATTNEVTLSNLDICTEYEFQVEAICFDLTSGFSMPFAFSTACMVDCDVVPSGIDTLAVHETSAEMTWDVVTDAITYNYRYRKIDDQDWMILEISGNAVLITALTDCTDYEFQVRANCGAGQNSAYSSSYEFKTDCITNINELESGIKSVELFPNPVDNQLFVQFNLLQTQDLNLEIFDVIGKQVHAEKGNFHSGQNEWNLEIDNNLNAGIYFLKISSEKGSLVRRIVKK